MRAVVLILLTSILLSACATQKDYPTYPSKTSMRSELMSLEAQINHYDMAIAAARARKSHHPVAFGPSRDLTMAANAGMNAQIDGEIMNYESLKSMLVSRKLHLESMLLSQQ